MNDARFKELLNLYLDHRLSAADAAELEAEVMRNPARRQTYAGYCRMQRACNLLFENECERAPQSFALTKALQDVERKLNGSAETRTRRQVVWLGWSGAAAAACVMFVSVTIALRDLPLGEAAASTELAAVESAGSAEVSAPVPAQHGVAVAKLDIVPAKVAPVLMASVSQPAILAVPDAAALQQLSRVAAQRWIDAEAAALVSSRLVDDGRFEVSNARSNDELPSFRSHQFLNTSTRGELTSYQFQR